MKETLNLFKEIEESLLEVFHGVWGDDFEQLPEKERKNLLGEMIEPFMEYLFGRVYQTFSSDEIKAKFDDLYEESLQEKKDKKYEAILAFLNEQCPSLSEIIESSLDEFSLLLQTNEMEDDWWSFAYEEQCCCSCKGKKCHCDQ